jgi:sulfotransferase family protein
MAAPPLFVLGVRRSGTTLLRVMLDRHSELAVPDESYFIPQLADRVRGPIDRDAFTQELRRLETLRDWGITAEEVSERLSSGMSPGKAISAIYETYAAKRGKSRWGDKTPMYMQYLGVLERLFPDARFVHLIRDGRDAATSFLRMPAGIVTKTWAHPMTPTAFACQWRYEVSAARALGRRVGPGRYLETRYESLVADPAGEMRRICEFAALSYEEGLTEYAGTVDVSAKPHQQSLTRPPTPGIRDWRDDMAPTDVAAFEAVAGDLLAALGYPLVSPEAAEPPSLRARLDRAAYAARSTAWRTAGRLVRRSPLWARRHPPLS